MLYFYRFAAGVLVGAIAVTLLKNRQARDVFEKAQDRLHDAVTAGIDAVRKGAAEARTRFDSDPVESVREAAAPIPTPEQKRPKARKRPAKREQGLKD